MSLPKDPFPHKVNLLHCNGMKKNICTAGRNDKVIIICLHKVTSFKTFTYQIGKIYIIDIKAIKYIILWVIGVPDLFNSLCWHLSSLSHSYFFFSSWFNSSEKSFFTFWYLILVLFSDEFWIARSLFRGEGATVIK